MRKLLPTKAIAHALSTVRDYASIGIKFSLVWTAIMLVFSVATNFTAKPGAPPDSFESISVLEMVSALVGLVAFCSIAVNWHRFILIDDASGSPLRLDGPVWRYAGNSVAIVAMAFLPLLVLGAIVALLPPAALVLLVPATILCGTLATALSIKLPAIALGKTDFGFGDAMRAIEGNVWQVMTVFLLNAAMGLVAILLIILLTALTGLLSQTLSLAAGIAAATALNIFYTLFNISVLSSLYGFFVEKRDF